MSFIKLRCEPVLILVEVRKRVEESYLRHEWLFKMSSKKFVSFGPWLFLHLHWETVHSGYGKFRTFLKLELDFFSPL